MQQPFPGASIRPEARDAEGCFRFVLKAACRSVQETHFVELLDAGVDSMVNKDLNRKPWVEGHSSLEDVLKAYAVASDYGVAEVTTAATFHVAALYQDFGRALMSSERPKKLSKSEREQYDVLLEEQAFPFEEKAISLHELNARRASEGLYDQWVQASFTAPFMSMILAGRASVRASV